MNNSNGKLGRRRHDIAQWGNPSFTQNRTNREYDRINYNHNGTWNHRGDESYNWGENSRRYEKPGVHKGKGPKGFIRSDERIREDINCRLTDDAYVDAANIEVSVENGDVVLTGSVPDRFEKRRAEDIVELVSGVSNVENRIRVVK